MYTYLLLDMPSDHEIEGFVMTECDVIRALLVNKGVGKSVKLIKFTTEESLGNIPQKPYKGIRYVHMSSHGLKNGIGLIGGRVEWKRVANWINEYLEPLSDKQTRALCLSCCFAEEGVKKMRPILKDYFNGIYYLSEEGQFFSTSMVVWSMFYYHKKKYSPTKRSGKMRSAKKLEDFFGEEVLKSKAL